MSNPLDPFSILHRPGDHRATKTQTKSKRIYWGQKERDGKDSQDGQQNNFEGSEMQDGDSEGRDNVFNDHKSIGGVSLGSSFFQRQSQMSENESFDEETEKKFTASFSNQNLQQFAKPASQILDLKNIHKAVPSKTEKEVHAPIIVEEQRDLDRRARLKQKLDKMEEEEEEQQEEGFDFLLNQKSIDGLRNNFNNNLPKIITKEDSEVEIEDQSSISRKLRDDQQSIDQENQNSSEADNQKYNEDEEEQQEEDEQEESEELDDKRRTIQLLKPVYVPKEERESAHQTDRNNNNNIIDNDEQEKLYEVKKQQAKQLLSDALKTENTQNDDDSMSEDYMLGVELPDDDDENNQQKEEEAWKLRELRRIKEQRVQRQKRLNQKQEIERRRNLTDEQRHQENKKLGSDATNVKEKRQINFLQKYYHQGAYYQDTDDPDLVNRDFNTPVGQDMFDKSNMPSILQKRRGNFGKKGNSKYTHLTNQDTTNFDPKVQVDQNIQFKLFSKQAGLKGSSILDRGDLKKLKL